MAPPRIRNLVARRNHSSSMPAQLHIATSRCEHSVLKQEAVMSVIEKVRYTTKTHTTGFNPEHLSDKLRAIGTHVTRYGLAVVLLWIGGMKFTAYEAEGIRPLVANSPLMGWA